MTPRSPQGTGAHGRHPAAPRGQSCTHEGPGGTHGKRLLRALHAIKLRPPQPTGTKKRRVRLWPRTEAYMDLLTTNSAIPTRLLATAVTEMGG